MEEKVPRSNIIETEIPMGTVHPAALEPYRVQSVLTIGELNVLWKDYLLKKLIP